MVVFVVSDNRGLSSALDRFAERHGSVVEIRQYRRVPRPATNERVFAVLDLTSAATRSARLPSTHQGLISYVALVRPGQLLALRWVEFIQDAGAALVKLRPGPRALVDLLALLERSKDGISPDEIAGAVVEEWKAPQTHGLLRLIFERPWQVRRTADLESESHMSRDELRAACRSVGFGRVEHFIVEARAVALSYLVATRKLSVGRARTILAIGNPSNFRRLLRRARVQRAG
jgi:hypothetical protein